MRNKNARIVRHHDRAASVTAKGGTGTGETKKRMEGSVRRDEQSYESPPKQSSTTWEENNAEGHRGTRTLAATSGGSSERGDGPEGVRAVLNRVDRLGTGTFGSSLAVRTDFLRVSSAAR